jgi:hypothetical protein
MKAITSLLSINYLAKLGGSIYDGGGVKRTVLNLRRNDGGCLNRTALCLSRKDGKCLKNSALLQANIEGIQI